MDKLELLEAYLDGNLSVKEQREFEDLLLKDLELFEEFTLRKNINQALLEDDIVRLRRTLNVITSSQPAGKKIFPLYAQISAVASLVLIISFSWFLFSKPNVSSDQLYDQYYTKYPSLNYNRSETHSDYKSNIINSAFIAYDDGAYAEAKELFIKSLEADEENIMFNYYLAICELELNNYKASEQIFLKLTQDSNHIFWEQSHWYLGMLYLKQNNQEKAEHYFKLIVQNKMCKFCDAKDILKSMN